MRALRGWKLDAEEHIPLHSISAKFQDQKKQSIDDNKSQSGDGMGTEWEEAHGNFVGCWNCSSCLSGWWLHGHM